MPSSTMTVEVRKGDSDGTERREERRTGARGGGSGDIGASVVFGVTTDSGAIDWVGIVMATAGLIMIVTGLFRTYRPGRT